MGHVISGKIKNGKTGLDIYKETVYNIDGERLTDDEALVLLDSEVSGYSVFQTNKDREKIQYNEIVPEMISLNYTKANKYTVEFFRLLKEARGL